MSKKFVYDQSDIHKVYRKARELPEETIDLWLDAIAANVSAPHKAILDLGCGEGRFCSPLARRFNCRVYAIDPSEKMLAIAKDKNRAPDQIEFLLGSAGSIPLPNHAVSLVFMSMVYHHLDEVAGMVSEVRRVLTSRGYVVIRNATREDILRNDLFGFFPGAKEIELQRMPDERDVILSFEARGFQVVDTRTIDQVFAHSYLDFYQKVSQRGLSALRLIPESDFEAGLNDFKHFCENKPPSTDVYEGFHLFVFRKKESAQ
jgi:ubiquinone/menaquinone biosynthesis C-methylase UbiE